MDPALFARLVESMQQMDDIISGRRPASRRRVVRRRKCDRSQ
jgi:hypothetical protein